MRAGTATKLVLNMLSTGTMIRLGYVYGNLMVNVEPTNVKLTDRARRIVASIAEVSYDEASRLLSVAGSVRVAILMHKLGIARGEAEARLAGANGRLRVALGESPRL
jgi:N-acetylmuramic acid 6-phosphate etherase